MIALPEYPRTLHLADSGKRPSKHGCDFAEVAGQHLVIEEKVDGSHCGLFFDEQAELRIFTRNIPNGGHGLWRITADGRRWPKRNIDRG